MKTFKYKQDGKDGSLAYPAGMYKVLNRDGSPFYLQMLADLSSQQMETYVNNAYADFLDYFPNGDFVIDLYSIKDIDDVTDIAFKDVVRSNATWYNPVLLDRPMSMDDWQQWHQAGGPGNYTYNSDMMASLFVKPLDKCQ